MAVPAQKNAGVIKSFNPSEEREKLAEWAREYTDELKCDIVRSAATVIPGLQSEAVNEICGALSLRSLKDLRDALRMSAQKNMPVIRQLESSDSDNGNENSEYKI